METIKVLAEATRPATKVGKMKLLVGTGLAGLYLVTRFFNWVRDYREDKYKLTVCWEHYRLSAKAEFFPEIYSSREIIRLHLAYRECIDAARSENPIPPLTSLS